jgi:hypothetical protein
MAAFRECLPFVAARTVVAGIVVKAFVLGMGVFPVGKGHTTRCSPSCCVLRGYLRPRVAVHGHAGRLAFEFNGVHDGDGAGGGGRMLGGHGDSCSLWLGRLVLQHWPPFWLVAPILLPIMLPCQLLSLTRA